MRKAPIKTKLNDSNMPLPKQDEIKHGFQQIDSTPPKNLSHNSTSYSSNKSNKIESDNKAQRQISAYSGPENYKSALVEEMTESVNLRSNQLNRLPRASDHVIQTAAFENFSDRPTVMTKAQETKVSENQPRGSPAKLLIDLEIGIGNGKSARLKYYENEDIQRVASAFCAKHNLPEELSSMVEDCINKNLRKLWKKSKQVKREKDIRSETRKPRAKKSRKSANKERPKIILTLDIDGAVKTVRVYENQDPFEVAETFCEKHGLNSEAKYYMAKTIQYHLNKFKLNPNPEVRSNGELFNNANYDHEVKNKYDGGSEDGEEVRDERGVIMRNIQPSKRKLESHYDDNHLDSLPPKLNDNHSATSRLEENYDKWENILQEKYKQGPASDRPKDRCIEYYLNGLQLKFS